MISHSQRADYFERKYQSDRNFLYHAVSPRERAKYASTLSLLPRPEYSNALELGCSTGGMTEQLAALCGQLTALDCAELALVEAKKRCHALDNVAFKKATVPDEYPVGRFDLITMCDMGYYLSLSDLMTTFALMSATLDPSGHILLVHQLGEVADGPLDANVVHEQVRKYPDLRSVVSVTRSDYLADLLKLAD